MMNSLELPRPPFPGLLGSQPDDAVHFACVNACKHGSKSRNQVWINEWSCDGICRLEIAGLTGVDVGMWSIYPYRGDGHCWRAADSGGADTGIDGCIHHREYRPAGHPTLQRLSAPGRKVNSLGLQLGEPRITHLHPSYQLVPRACRRAHEPPIMPGRVQLVRLR